VSALRRVGVREMRWRGESHGGTEDTEVFGVWWMTPGLDLSVSGARRLADGVGPRQNAFEADPKTSVSSVRLPLQRYSAPLTEN
jgi:hypothetical protein